MGQPSTMTETSYKRALDGAHAVRVYDHGAFDVIFTWHGGTTINVYIAEGGGTLRETTCHSVSDEKGRPVDREEMVDHMDDLNETLLEEHR